MATDRQTAANRRNAGKSTGPKTPEGKAASAQNAVTHGMTAQNFNPFPDLDAAAFKESLSAWTADLDPEGAVETALVGMACRAHWRLDRCARHETAVLAHHVRHASTVNRLKDHARACELGRHLLFEPIERLAGPCAPPELVERMSLDPLMDPAVLANELGSFGAGVDWLLERWAELAGILEREKFGHYPEKVIAAKLLGSRPEDILSDTTVGWIFAAAYACHPEPLKVWGEVHIATCGRYDKPCYLYRTDFFATCSPATPEEGRAALVEIIEKEVARLKKKKLERLDLLSLQDRFESVDRARFDGGPTAALRLRYETAAARDFYRALGELSKLRKDADRREPMTVDTAATCCEETANVVAESAPTDSPADAPNEPNSEHASPARRRENTPNEPGPTASERPDRAPKGRRRAKAPRSDRR